MEWILGLILFLLVVSVFKSKTTSNSSANKTVKSSSSPKRIGRFVSGVMSGIKKVDKMMKASKPTRKSGRFGRK